MPKRTSSRVLVTGATGFLGARLCAALLSEGCDVYGVCRPGSPPLHAAATRLECPLGDAGSVTRLVEQLAPDTIFHVAGFTSAARDLSAVVPSFQANVASTVHLLRAASTTGCRRIVLAGSLEEPQSPGAVSSSPYAASKAAATTYAQMFWQVFRTPITLARIFMVYGPAQRDVKKLVPYTILSLLQGRRPQFTSGTRRVDWVFVDDVIRGMIELGRAKGVEGATVDLGTGIATSVRDVAQGIADVLEPGTVLTFGDVPDRQNEEIRVADVARTEALLGWKPAIPLRDGLLRTIAYYRARSDLVGARCGPVSAFRT